MSRLKDKVAIVTGAARGQGFETARCFAAEGASVIATDIRLDRKQEGERESDSQIAFHEHDVSDAADWKRISDLAIFQFGRIDILVNNAGIVHIAPFGDTQRSDFDKVLNVNLVGAYLGIQSVLPFMLERQAGSVVNISSFAGLTGMAGMSLYSASKWGLRGLTRSLAREYASKGLRFNSVHPGTIDTPMLNPNGDLDTVAAAAQQGIPIQRLGRPDEVANVSLFLASDEASYVTGAEFTVDGGWLSGVGSDGAVVPDE